MAVSDWSTDANANTTVGGIAIGENCPPGNLNDGERHIMAEAKAKFDQIDASLGTSGVIGALTPAADTFPYFTSLTTAALAALTSFGRSFIAAADAPAARIVLGTPATADFTTGSNAWGFWSKRPDGFGGFLIEQWGSQYSGTNGWSSDYQFPIAFPTAVEFMSATGSDANFSSADGNTTVASPSLSSPLAAFRIGNTDGPPMPTYWMARGR